MAGSLGNWKHGATKNGRVTPEYRTWRQMIARCYTKSAGGYVAYGGRGITVCDRWRRSFAYFLIDMGFRPTLKHTIDRIDSTGNYEPSNCRWATQAEQARNRSNNITITANGKSQCATDWETDLGLPLGTIRHRVRRNWGVERILSTPVRKYKKEVKGP
jgi:hypothetical protein